MLVTGVQPAGAKGVAEVQGTVVDVKAATRVGAGGDRDGERSVAPTRSGNPQPVVFPRKGVPVDQRPVSLRHQQAAARYRSDGGGRQHDDAA